ncbi:MAG: threo-3-hydroxy-L-aspartate ammonia-lyase [Betaproteobacteria bacterium]|nr:MAG: threo-3-hydroxy-L-aspartate ammonia-lyase [Betaproteobacteria bacterium]
MNSTTANQLPLSAEDIDGAAKRLLGHALRTPVLTSRTVDERTGAQVFFKCENFQRMGAFKFRGAFNALSRLTPEQKQRGVLAYSSGNHAQAVALAGSLLGVKAVIVMPLDAPQVKLQATRGYGAEVITYDPQTAVREELATRIASERGMTLIPPYNHVDIVAGQGTAAKELIEQAGELDYLLVPCGGGGLLSGCAVAASHWSPRCKVIGIEPAAGDDATRSFHSKTLQTCSNPDTIADGARTPSLGSITFPLVLHYVHDMLTVSDAELLRSMFWIWERMKIVIEPTGALAAAALLEGKLDGRHDCKGKRVGVVVSGGNADIKALCRLV